MSLFLWFSSSQIILPLLFLICIAYFLKKVPCQTFLIPRFWQIFIEKLYNIVATIVHDNFGKQGQIILPILLTQFLFIFALNFNGLLPFGVATTCHLLLTFFFVITNFITIFFCGFNKFSWGIIAGVAPTLKQMLYNFILIPLETLSAFARPLSLSLRLFINLLAGHILLSVVSFFLSLFLSSSSPDLFFWFFILCILLGISYLELAFSFMQAYIFTMLTALYLRFAIKRH